MNLSTAQLENLRSDITAGFRKARPRSLRTISQFSVDEIQLPPTGPFGGEQFEIDRQPFARLWFGLIESGLFVRYAATGPLQSGKTLLCFVIPLMYHLFEVGENVVCGVPNMVMAMDKWNQDLLPVILASRYASEIPTSGEGSQGGKFESITFRNGATLKFMSAKGGDEKRSGFTARVLVMTEIDKFDEASESSREADPVTQMIGRLESFEVLNTIVYMECSVSIVTGRIWVEVTSGSNSRIATQCPHCRNYVTLERQDLRGWQDAGNEIDARDWSQFVCSACAAPWSEDDRIVANKTAKLVHKGQEINSDGEISGPVPKTLTAGFRWTAANNLFKPAADFGWKEWKAQYDPDEENGEKTLLQFTWALPWEGEINDGIELTPSIIAGRLSGLPRYEIPDDTVTLVAHVDLHKRWHNCTVVATSGEGARKWHTVVDYFPVQTPWVEGTDNHVAAMRQALLYVRDELNGKQFVTTSGVEWSIDLHLVDAGYEQDMALKVVNEFGKTWLLCKGHNPAEKRSGYRPPREATDDVVPGFHFHFSKQPAKPEIGINRFWWLTVVDTDYWMRQVHAGFQTAVMNGTERQPGSIALFGADASVHLQPAILKRHRSSFAEQILGWKWVSDFDPRKGEVQGWTPGDCQDHWLDNMYNCLAGDAVVRQLHARFKRQEEAAVPERQPVTTPDGRKFLVTNRE